MMFLLVAGLGALLLLNTLLAQGAFAVHDLDRQVTALSDREQALQQKVAELAAPQRLARQASRIGM
ncbi:MAG TPA: cell division protein FtsL, partial [Actinomycetes bacterium]|nr:cell division protein FtsL [Actinomycetes bacterium]